MKTNGAAVYKTTHLARHESLEGVPLASFKARAIAMAIDAALIGVILLLLNLWLRPEVKVGDTTFSFEFHGLTSFLVFTLYFGISTAVGHGATLGKKLLGIRVISTVRDHLSFWHSLERALGYSASSLEAGIGFLQYFTHPNRQTVHDRIAETIVIKSRGRNP